MVGGLCIVLLIIASGVHLVTTIQGGNFGGVVGYDVAAVHRDDLEFYLGDNANA